MPISGLISIIVPTFNRAYCLEKCIKSVINQSYSEWELIIVDNHSTDMTQELVASFASEKIRLINIHNSGIVAASRNLGVKESKGAYLAFLDSDDWWTPRKLEYSLELLESGADLVYHDLYLMKQGQQKKNILSVARSRKVDIPVFNDLLTNGNAIINSSVVLRKSILESVGGFSEDESLVAAEDYDAWMRIAKITNRFKRLNKCSGFYMVGHVSLSSSQKTINSTNKILEIYKNELSDLKIKSPPWANYLLGRANYTNNSNRVAFEQFVEVVKTSKNWRLIARAVCYIALISFKKFRRQ